MTLVQYNPESHKSDLVEMLRSRDMPVGLADTLPRFGFVAYMDKLPVAAGFTRDIEGGMLMLDSYVSHAVMPGAVRNIALNNITEALLTQGAFQRKHLILAFTKDENTHLRTFARGFHLNAYPCSVLDLSRRIK